MQLFVGQAFLGYLHYDNFPRDSGADVWKSTKAGKEGNISCADLRRGIQRKYLPLITRCTQCAVLSPVLTYPLE